MISLINATNVIENELNKNNLGLTIKLFSDTGKYKKAIREYNNQIDYVNGIVSLSQSDVSKTNDGLIVGTLTARVELLFRCKDFEEDIETKVEKLNAKGETKIVTELIQGNESYFENIRNWLDVFCQNNTYKLLTDSEFNQFDTSISYDLAVGGVRNQVPRVGDSMTYVVYAYLNFIQNGENSLNNQFFLDGEKIPYTVCTVRRVPTVEMDVYSNTKDGSAKATVSNTVWGLSLTAPTFITKFSQAVKNYLINGERNVVHFLEHRIMKNGAVDVSKTYLVLFGEGSGTYQDILNAGQEISFVEAVDDYELMAFPSNFYIYQKIGSQYSGTLTFQQEASAFSTADYQAQSGTELPLKLTIDCYVVSTAPVVDTQKSLFTVIQNGNL